MKKPLIFTGLIIVCIQLSYAQSNVGIGTLTPNANTMLDVQAASNKNGILAETAGNGIAIQAIGRGNAAAINVLKPANSSGQGIYIEHQGTDGPVAQIRRTNANASGAAIIGYNNSTLAQSPAIYALHEGTGDPAFVARVSNTQSANAAVFAETNGTGTAIFASQLGTGRSGQFQITNAANTEAALRGFTNGTGRAGFFTISNAANTSAAVYAQTNGTGSAIMGSNSNNGYALAMESGGMKVTTAYLTGASSTISTRATAYLISGSGPFTFGFSLDEGEIIFFHNLNASPVTINGITIPANSGKTFITFAGILREM